MGSLSGFNAAEVSPLGDRSPLPPGKYTASIAGCQWKKTKAGDGEYLEFEFEVIEGEYEGRHLWSRLNLKNKNEKAVAIAKRELSSICRATGILTPDDPDNFDNKLLGLVVVARDDEYNDIKDYFQLGEAKTNDLPF